MVELPNGVPSYTHIDQNDFRGHKPKKLKDDDIAICNCKYNPNEPESACGERCLNVLTSTECTPGYCPCNDFCKNQKFQKCEYVKTKLFQTEGRGWGLLADEDIKAGQFVIEYCGEVISLEEAKQRVQSYESEGLRDAYIISLNCNNFIDATKKGSLARFINHSCLPNCETRKWTVLGETRVGIFANVDICSGTELTYNYNFEWYGGATVRCLCGAANCCKFLGARSQGFQEYSHVWEEGDDRYKVEEVPLYDSAEDEPFPQMCKTISSFKFESVDGAGIDYSLKAEGDEASELKLNFDSVKPGSSVLMGEVSLKEDIVVSLDSGSLNKQGSELGFLQTTEMAPRLRSTSAGRNFNAGASPSKRKSKQHKSKQKKRSSGGQQFNTRDIPILFQSKEVQDEVRKYEELKNQATTDLQSLYDEIRPAIEQHESNSQDSVPTSVGEKWIGAHCNKYRADFDFSFSIIKNFLDAAKNATGSQIHGQNSAGAGISAQPTDAGMEAIGSGDPGNV
ncbi:OLC1v1017657C1 [Oldenlandia corymbosa var. corymbosa]|uniref:OLC1v1017657C1 n=1 Tax=Oldenlandia corymbosa var. corymbosa TaxID=529605 RepID=A0AAV1E9Y7_OLDCO|nr:OLC1v1017657C1 [Oldenlandia corymbosa var. corymbosa]